MFKKQNNKIESYCFLGKYNLNEIYIEIQYTFTLIKKTLI